MLQPSRSYFGVGIFLLSYNCDRKHSLRSDSWKLFRPRETVSKSSFVSCPSKDSNFLKIAEKPRDSTPGFSQSAVLLVPSIISPILS